MLKRITRPFTLLISALLFAATAAAAQTNSLFLDNTPDFLPVHEAYQLEVFAHENQLLLNWEIADGYFLYGDQFQFSLEDQQQALPIDIQQEAGEVSYDDYFEKEVEKFHRFTTHTIHATEVNDNTLTFSARFQGCAEAGLCYPPETLYYQINFSTLTATPIEKPTTQTKHPANNASFGLMFAFALLGGLILNLMPCVFPVLSIKLLSFVKSNQSDTHLKEHSWFYTFGVLATFLTIALTLILLRQSGAIIGWGFQLQSPMFIGFLALLFFILALSLSDVITLGTRLMGVGQQLTEGNHYHHSFFTGVLAVIVASPCSVPFMGVALGYALTQPTYAALIIFFGLGVGLAAPFLLFAYIPWLIQHLPKPGPWMQTLKHWFALPLYITTAWLLWVLFHQLNTNTELNTAHKGAEPYTAQALEYYLEQQQPVFINLTADWCITCLVNEKTALSTDAVQKAFTDNNVHYLVGDWTNGDEEITKLLEQHGRAGVPLYIYYNAQGKITIFPQLLTTNRILEALQKNTHP